MPTTIEKEAAKLVLLCDLDGCIIDESWRHKYLPHPDGHHLPGTKNSSYDEYNSNICNDDRPMNLDILERAIAVGISIIFITARPNRWRQVTETQLRELGLGFAIGTGGRYTLVMRNDNDERHSWEIKKEFVLLHLRDYGFKKEDVVLAIDDRDDIVNAYRGAGIPAFRVGKGFRQLTGAGPLQKALLTGEDADGFPLKFSTGTMCSANPRGLLDAGVTEIDTNVDVATATKSRLDSIDSAATTTSEGIAKALERAAVTFRERNAAYKSNYQMIAPMVRTLFPDGVPSRLVAHDSWHLFELLLVKLSRFAVSEFTHQDSIHDATVYAAMIEATTKDLSK